MADGKVTKKSVNYRKMLNISKRCGNCTMIRRHSGRPPSCTLVAGNIDPLYVCDKWEGTWQWQGSKSK